VVDTDQRGRILGQPFHQASPTTFYVGRNGSSRPLTSIRLSPRDPGLWGFYEVKGEGYFVMRQDDRAIEWTQRSVAMVPIGDRDPYAMLMLASAFALIIRNGWLQHNLPAPWRSGPPATAPFAKLLDEISDQATK
jgi:hypothetical protein